MAIDPAYEVIGIQTNIDAMLGGSEPARRQARDDLEAALARYGDDCRVGFVLTFGHDQNGRGEELARTINEILESEFSEMFDGAAYDAFIDATGRSPAGYVTIRIYFYTGCLGAGEPLPRPSPTPMDIDQPTGAG